MKKAGVIGLGLIGGSISLALKENGYRVVGSDISDGVMSYALERGIIDAKAKINELADCEVVFVCVPLSVTRETVIRVSEIAGGNAIITDVASVKGILDGVKGRIIGGHPMAGTEKSGITAARSHLFENAYYVLVKGEQATESDLAYMRELVGAFKARPIIMTSAEHDRRASKVSHLPHVIAYALAELALSEDGFTGTGFMDATRIAASDAEFWADVAMLNEENLAADLAEYTGMLEKCRGYIEAHDKSALVGFFDSARRKREALTYKRVYLSEYTLDLDVKDEVGAISRVSKLLADNGINISGIQIVDSREGVGGALRIGVKAESDFVRATELLGLKDKR